MTKAQQNAARAHRRRVASIERLVRPFWAPALYGRDVVRALERQINSGAGIQPAANQPSAPGADFQHHPGEARRYKVRAPMIPGDIEARPGAEMRSTAGAPSGVPIRTGALSIMRRR